MKKLLLGLLSLTFLLSCGEKKEPIWEYQSNLDLQTRYLNRIIELSGNDKFLRVFKRVGEKKELLNTGDYVITAFIDLGEVKVKSDHKNREYIIICPEPEIEPRNNHEGYDNMSVEWSKIDKKEGRRDFTANERQKAVTETIKTLNKEIRDNKNHPIIKQLISDAKNNARINLPLFLKKLDIDKGYRIKVEFPNDKGK